MRRTAFNNPGKSPGGYSIRDPPSEIRYSSGKSRTSLSLMG